MPSEETFVNRLGEIPVLNDTWTTAWGCYAKIKDMNTLTKYTLETAESSMKTAAMISTPVVTRYQPQIESLNSFACTKLDELENKYPVIKLPSEQVKDACLEYVQPVVSSVKPVVTRVQAVVDDSRRRVQNIQSQGQRLVVGARDLSIGTVSRTLDTLPGRLATRTADGVLTIADGLLEKYIPEETIDADQGGECTDSDNDSDGEDEPQNEVQEMEMMESSPERVVVHFKTVSRKLRQRLFQRAMRNFQRAKVRTQEGLGKLNGVADLMDYAKNNIGSARGKAEDMWQKITADVDGNDTQNVSVFAGSLEERIITLGRMMTHQVRSGIHTIEKAAHSAGQFARNPISKSKEYKDLIVQFASLESLQNMSSASVENVRHNVRIIQNKVQQLISNVESPSWMGVHIDMDEIEIEDNDILNQAAEELVLNRELVRVVEEPALEDLELNNELDNSRHRNPAE